MLLIALMLACSDYSLYPGKPGGGSDTGVVTSDGGSGSGADTGGGGNITPFPGYDECYRLNVVQSNSSNDGWDAATGVCLFRGVDAHGTTVEFTGNKQVENYIIAGLGGAASELGGEGRVPTVPTRFGELDIGATQTEWVEGTASHAGLSTEDPSADPHLSGGDGLWYIEFQRADERVGSPFDELDESCGVAWEPYVAIQDPDFGGITEGDPLGCQDRYSDVIWCVQWTDDCVEEAGGPGTGGTGSPPPSPPPLVESCAPGYGSFLLVPDAPPRLPPNDEGTVRQIWPVAWKVNGALTDDAEVRWFQTHPVNAGMALQPPVLGAEGPWIVTASDPLLGAGDLDFVDTAVLDAAAGGAWAEVGWTCPAPAPANSSPVPPSYTFTLNDVGCPFPWDERFVVRFDAPGIDPLSPGLAPATTFAEVHGQAVSPTYRLPISKAEGPPLWNFNGDIGLLHVEGTFSTFTSDSVTVHTTVVTLDGLSLCDTGTYTLPRIGIASP